MNNLAYPCPECPEDCGDLELPEFVSDDCIDGSVDELSEINKVYIALVDPEDPTKPLDGPADWTSKTAWLAVIGNTGANKVRRIFGSGEIPDPEQTKRQLHSHKEKVVKSLYKLRFEITNMHQTNYEAYLKFQCGGTVRIWWETIGGYMYGGQNGVGCDIPGGSSPFGKGKDAYKSLFLDFIFNAKCDAPRIASPFGESTTPPPVVP